MCSHATRSHLSGFNLKFCASFVTIITCCVLPIILFQLDAFGENSLRPETITSTRYPTFNYKNNSILPSSFRKNDNDMNDELARKMAPLIFTQKPENSSCAKLLSVLTPYAANEYLHAHGPSNNGCERPNLTFQIPQLVTNATSYSGRGTIQIPTNPSPWNVYTTKHDTAEPKWLPGGETKAAYHVGGALNMNDEVTNKTMLKLPNWSLWENVCATSWHGPLWWVLPSTTSDETLNRLNSELSACRNEVLDGCWSHKQGCNSCRNDFVRTIVSGLSRRIKAKFVRSSANLKHTHAISGTTLMFDFWLSPKLATHIAHYTFKLGEAFELGLMQSISPAPAIHSVLFRDTWGYASLKKSMSPWIQAFDAASWAVMPFKHYGPEKGKVLSLSQDFPSKVVCFERLLWRPQYGQFFHTPIGSVAMQSLMLRMLNNSESPRLMKAPPRSQNITQIMELTLDDALGKVHQIRRGHMCPPSTVLVAHRGIGGNGRRAFYNRDEVIATIANVTGFPRSRIKEITMTSKISALEAVSAWSNAGLIVSPHGSQLVNVISSSPGSVILEVAPTVSKDFASLTQTCGGTHMYSQGHRPFPMDASLSEAYNACVPGMKPTCVSKFNQRLKFINSMKINLSIFRKDLKFAMRILAKQCENTSSDWANIEAGANNDSNHKIV